MRYSKYNVVIIGSGISGLYLANKLSETNKFSDGILLITKDKLFSGSSALAQGGMVSVIPEINKSDSIESHIKDTLKAGCGINNLSAVKFVSENSALAAQELIRYGVEFDKIDKKLNFTLEGAHSCPRILHACGDSTGRIIEEVLCSCLEKTSNVDVYEDTMAIDLLINANNECKGVICFNSYNKSFETIYASKVVIATGGIGQIYKNTTNPAVSTSDGIALAYRAGAEMENMEFVQFHPTALYCKNKTTMPLVSESARGEGAKLVDLDGEYFAKNYHHLADLAPRDIVARSIMQQMKKTNTDYVNLDISQIGIEKFKNRFPTITKLCEENGIDLSSGLIPVVPAEHYFMGGIKTDLNSLTSIKNLYAIGECASTGLHGANRLASNSLLECVVFAHNLASLLSLDIIAPPKKFDEKIKNLVDFYVENQESGNSQDELIMMLFDDLKKLMTNNVGITRTESKLTEAIEDIENMELRIKQINCADSKVKFEFLNALITSKLVATAALRRKNSIGAHYRADFPHLSVENNKNEGSMIYDKILVK